MGNAKEKAAEIKQLKQDKLQARQWALTVRSEIRQQAPALWEELVACTENERKELVEAFSEVCSEANALLSYRPTGNGNVFVVSREALPRVEVKMISKFDEGCVCCSVMTQKRRSAPIIENLGPFRFSLAVVEDGFAPCFKDGDMHLSPEQVAETVMNPVSAFFKEVALSDI